MRTERPQRAPARAPVRAPSVPPPVRPEPAATFERSRDPFPARAGIVSGLLLGGSFSAALLGHAIAGAPGAVVGILVGSLGATLGIVAARPDIDELVR